MTGPINLYDNVYADFGSDAERAVRQEAYGEDLGQSSWLTAREWLEFADLLGIGAEAEVLEVGSGSGGPAVYLAAACDCRVTGVDINQHGVRNAGTLAQPAAALRRRELRCGHLQRRHVPHRRPAGRAA
jgi:SAM-dependent methyltransferase